MSTRLYEHKFSVQTNRLRKYLLTVALILPFIGIAQVARQPLTIQYAGMGAYSNHFVDVFSAMSNQAALARLTGGGLGVFSERRFSLQELSQYSGIVALPTATGTFALQGDYFGGSIFNQNQLGLSYGRMVSNNIDVGVKFNYHTINTAGYGQAGAFNFEAGTIFHLTQQLHTGLHVYNPLSSKLGKTGETLPAIYKAGLGYEASTTVLLTTEFVKQEDENLQVNVGLQYNIHPRVLLRAGLSTANNNSYTGVGIRLHQFRLDVNAGYHQQLGFTPGLLLLVHFKKPATDAE